MWPKAALQMPRVCEFRCLETANTGLFQVFVIYRDFGTYCGCKGFCLRRFAVRISAFYSKSSTALKRI